MPIAVLRQAAARPWKRTSDDSQIDVAVLGKLRIALQRELGADKQQLGKVFSRHRAKLLSQLPLDGLAPRLRLWTEVMGQEYARVFLEAEPTLILLHPLTLLGSLEGVSQVLRMPPRRAVEYLLRHQYLVGVTTDSIQQSLAVLQQQLGVAPEDAVALFAQWGQLLYMRPDVLQQKVTLLLQVFALDSADASAADVRDGVGASSTLASSSSSSSRELQGEEAGGAAAGVSQPLAGPGPESVVQRQALSGPASTSTSGAGTGGWGPGTGEASGVVDGAAEARVREVVDGAAVARVREVARMLLRRPQLLTKSTASLEQRLRLLADVLGLGAEEVKRMALAQPAILGVDPEKAAARWARLLAYGEQYGPWVAEAEALLPWQKARTLMLQERDFHRVEWVLQRGLAGAAGGQDLAGVLFYARKFLAAHPEYVAPEGGEAGAVAGGAAREGAVAVA